MGAAPPKKRDKAGGAKAADPPALLERATTRAANRSGGRGGPGVTTATARPPARRGRAAAGAAAAAVATPAPAPRRRQPPPPPSESEGEEGEEDAPSSGTASPVVTDSDEDVPAPGFELGGGRAAAAAADGPTSSSDDDDADDESTEYDEASDSDSDDPAAAAAGWGSDDASDGLADPAAAAARYGGAFGGDTDTNPPPPFPTRPPRAGSPGDDDDSSDGGRPNRNTAGDVPLEWYREEGHVGYDVDGGRLDRRARGDRLDAVLARADSGKALRTLYDEYNDEEIVLSRAELKMVRAIRSGRFPHVDVDPFEAEADWYSRDTAIHPLNAAPEPKRRFMPSKWEERAVVRLVRALRRGWIKPRAQREAEAAAADAGSDGEGGRGGLLGGAVGPLYMMWGDDGLGAGDGSSHTAAGLSYVPAPKPALPGHADSYNPPLEYLPKEEDEEGGEGDGKTTTLTLPRAFPNLRSVPAYADFIKDRFERCLDLYLCPRARKKTAWVEDAASLLPDLPKPADLRPYPRRLAARLAGAGKAGTVLRGLAVDPSGQWVAAGGDGGVVTVWEVANGRRAGVVDAAGLAGFSGPRAPAADRRVACVAWRPGPAGKAAPLLAIAVGTSIVITPPPAGVGAETQATAAADAVRAALDAAARPGGPPSASSWKAASAPASAPPALRIDAGAHAAHVAWHGAGDYFVSTAPAAPGAKAVAVHRLSGGTTQTPFRKLKGKAALATFHPTRPALLVSSGGHVRVYDLAAQALAQKLVGGSGGAAALAVHPRGDHVLLGSADARLAWYDLDLATTPYRALRYHKGPLTAAAFHPTYPLFASGAADGAAHVFHGTVYADLLTPPLIVPLKVLAGAHGPDSTGEGVTALAWHPHQPWLFTAGVGGEVCMWVDDC
jgi:ribosome biogenesis protein ERB1